MSSEWQTKTLNEVCIKITDGAHNSPKSVTVGKSMASVKDLTRFGVDLSQARLIANEDFETLVKQGCKPEIGDILIAKDGNSALDTVCTVKKPLEAVVLSSVAILRPDPSQLNSDYLKYYFSSIDVIDYLKSNFISGAAIPRVVLRDFKKAKITLPQLEEQNEIATILGALDDRIELLQQANTTLEAIAQALFKSWFVDFDPVHAKQQGRELEGMDSETAALFPDCFEESELGLVPKGWRVGRLGEYARQHKGSVNPLKQPDTKFDHFSLPAFDNGQIPVTELGVTILSNKTTMPADAVLLSKLNPRIPRIWLPIEVSQNAVCSTEFLVFVPDAGASKEFIYCSFATDQFQQLLCQLVTGTSNSHQRVKPDAVSKMLVVIPSTATLHVFEEIVKPLFDRIGKNRLKAQTLASCSICPPLPAAIFA